MEVPRRKLLSNSVNTLSITDDLLHDSQNKPVPRPRTSKGGPSMTKKIDLKSGKQINVTPKASKDQIKFSESFDHQVKSKNNQTAARKYSPVRKQVNIKTNQSQSDESFSESLKYLRESDLLSSGSAIKAVTKHVDSQGKIHDLHADKPALDKLQIYSESDPERKPEKSRKIGRSVQLSGNKLQSLQSNDFTDFASEQGLESLASMSSEEIQKRSPSRKIAFDKEGKKSVVLSSDFEEYTVSTLHSLSEKNSTLEAIGNRKPKTKSISLKEDDVLYSQELQDYSSQSLLNLKEISDLDTNESNRPLRQVTSHVNTAAGSRNVTYSSEFESFSQGHGLGCLRGFNSETDLESLSKSKDKGPQTSWREGKQGKQYTNVSDEFENYSLGPAIEFKSNQREKKREVYKTVAYKDGKRLVSYSDELLNTLSYSDDFEVTDSSWAVKLRRDFDQSLVTKRVEYKDGKKYVTYSSDLENTNLKKEKSTDCIGSPFREIALEDLDYHSYTEDFESATAKAITAKSETSIATEDIDYTEVWSSSSPQTTHHVSLKRRPSNKNAPSRETSVYSESYETVTSLPQSDTYSLTEDTSVLSLHRPRVTVKDLSEDEDSYTMTFSEATEESEEESPEEAKKTELARDAFVKRKLKIVGKSKVQRHIPLPMEEKLYGEEAKQFSNFVKQRLKVVKNKDTGICDMNVNPATKSARSQLRGIVKDCSVETYGISPSAIARLKMENTMRHIQDAAEQDMHDPYTCEHCSDKVAEHAARKFMWHKKAIVSEKLVQEKMEMQMLQLQDPVWLFAEALRGLPKLSDRREEVYDKLMKPLFDVYAVNASNYEN